MKRLRLYGGAMALALVFMLAGCVGTPAAVPTVVWAAPPAEIVQRTYLFEVMRYLYRWQLEESEVERAVSEKRMVFWIRRLDVALDAGDRSIEGEIILPQVGLSVRLKKADYTIEETKLVVKNLHFQIQRVTRGGVPAKAPAGCQVVEVDMTEMREYLFHTRNQHDYPEPKLLEHLRQAVRQEATKLGLEMPAVGEQIVHIAPLSPVASEIWVYWENGHKLIYFSSDIDLANPALWDYEPLMVHVYDLEDQVVVTQQEAESSNRYLTRYQVSRTLFNCLVFGERITLTPVSATGSGPGP